MFANFDEMFYNKANKDVGGNMKVPFIRFKNHKILGDLEIDFRDKKGETYNNIIFVGENGCGKTTLLRELNNFPNQVHFRDFMKKYCVLTGRRLNWSSVFLKEKINLIHVRDDQDDKYYQFGVLDKSKKNRLKISCSTQNPIGLLT